MSQFSQAKYTYESQPGSYVARNQGISIAKGDILAFTDSDCIPNSEWIEKGVSCLSSTTNCGLVAGRIDLFFKNPEKPTVVELYEIIELNFEQEKNIREQHFGVTANLFTYKHVIEKVGAFNAALKSGGDREWGERVFTAGYKQVYADNALIKHPARHSFSELYKRMARFVGGKYDLMMSQNPSLIYRFINFIGIFQPPIRSFYRIATNPTLNGFKQKIKFIYAMFFVRYIVINETLRLYLGGVSKKE